MGTHILQQHFESAKIRYQGLEGGAWAERERGDDLCKL